MKYKNILYVTSECSGFASSGGLAEVAGSLPQAIQNAKKSYKVKVVMPLYKKIVDTYQSELKYIGNENVVLAHSKRGDILGLEEKWYRLLFYR